MDGTDLRLDFLRYRRVAGRMGDRGLIQAGALRRSVSAGTIFASVTDRQDDPQATRRSLHLRLGGANS